MAENIDDVMRVVYVIRKELRGLSYDEALTALAAFMRKAHKPTTDAAAAELARSFVAGIVSKRNEDGSD